MPAATTERFTGSQADALFRRGGFLVRKGSFIASFGTSDPRRFPGITTKSAALPTLVGMRWALSLR